jgi:hypothetical protein
VWDVTVFTKNRGRLIAGDIAAQFMAAVLNQERERCGPRRNRRASFVAAGSSPRWPLWQVFPGSGHGHFAPGRSGVHTPRIAVKRRRYRDRRVHRQWKAE